MEQSTNPSQQLDEQAAADPTCKTSTQNLNTFSPHDFGEDEKDLWDLIELNKFEEILYRRGMNWVMKNIGEESAESIYFWVRHLER